MDFNWDTAIAQRDYEPNSSPRSVDASSKSDYDYAYRLQEEEYAKQRVKEPEYALSRLPSSTKDAYKKTRISKMLGAISKSLASVTKVCDGCQKRIYGSLHVIDGKCYHHECRRRYVNESCCICHQLLPQIGKKITWCEHPFWKERFCHIHNQDGTRSCASCERLKAIDVRWIELNDGRQICTDCSQSMIIDDCAAQQLYNNIIEFYASLNLFLPVIPSLTLVDRHALNERTFHDQHQWDTSQTRGMTLAEEYRTIKNVIRQDHRFLGQAYEMYPVEHRECRVTGILILFGLPRLLTGSIMAHEVMHAYLKLTMNMSLDSTIEEGLCQLMAYLWIENQTPEDAFRKRLCSFIATQIREHPSPVYGDGFRMALDCFQSYGLVNLINHVRITGQFPVQGP
eukprot:g3283.t1